MTKGYSEQNAGAKLCIDLASDWAGECIADLNIEDNLFLMDYGAADGVISCDETFVSPYTMTNDFNFILDKPKTNINVFSGGSGQSFKFAPLIGKCLAEKALNKNCSFDISCWEFDIFLTTK